MSWSCRLFFVLAMSLAFPQRRGAKHDRPQAYATIAGMAADVRITKSTDPGCPWACRTGAPPATQAGATA